MFKNHAFQVKMVKDPNQDAPAPTVVCRHITADMVTASVKESVKITSIAVIGGIAALKVVDTACEIAKIYASK
jgi:hypothetical protein